MGDLSSRREADNPLLAFANAAGFGGKKK